MSNARDIIVRPLITEKTMKLQEADNKVTFEVAKGSNKTQVKIAVEEIFNVKVESVNTVNVLGKVKRMGRNLGKRSDYKKAIVKLAAGETIEFFQA